MVLASGVVKCDQCQNAVKDGEYQNLDSGHVLCDRCRGKVGGGGGGSRVFVAVVVYVPLYSYTI